MKILLIRHGLTEWNLAGRYQGRSDLPLCEAGRAALRPTALCPGRVYTSGLRRAAETAEILFPHAEQVALPDLAEMDFGVFEGKSWRELSGDEDYQAWVDSYCTGKIPGGESRVEFCRRVCGCFAPLVSRALREGEETLVVVAHGGTQMAVLERFARPHRDYFDWKCPPGGGFLLETDPERWAAGVLTLCGEWRNEEG